MTNRTVSERGGEPFRSSSGRDAVPDRGGPDRTTSTRGSLVVADQPGAARTPLDRDHVERDSEVPVAKPLLTRIRESGHRGPALAVCAVLALWALSIPQIDIHGMGDYGLLTQLPVTWFAGLGLLIVTSAVLLVRPRTATALLVACGIGFTLYLHGTFPAVTEVPQYPWVYKHIGVVSHITAHHGLDTSLDIYNRWPGFFALAAMFGELAGIKDQTSVAAWAELTFAIFNLFLVYALGRALRCDRMVAWAAAYIYTAIDWIAQTYYAPQALAMTLAIAAFAVAFRYLPPLVSASEDTLRLNIRPRFRPLRLRWLRSLTQARQVEDRPLPPRLVAVGLFALLDVVIVATHQLTPYEVMLVTFALVVAGAARPMWLAALTVGVTILYLVPNYSYLETNFGVLDHLNPLANATSQKKQTSEKIFGAALAADTALLLVLVCWATAMCAAIALYRSGQRLVPVACGLVLLVNPILLFAQGYGGEGIFRVFLFSQPWAAVLIGQGLLSRRRGWLTRTAKRRAVALGTFLLVTCGLFLPAFFGLGETRSVSSQDVAAARWYYSHTPPGSVLLTAAGSFPQSLTANYDQYPAPESNRPLLDPAETLFGAADLGRNPQRDLTTIAARMNQTGPNTYLVFSASQVVVAHVYRLAPEGAIAGLEDEVRQDSRFQQVYDNGTVRMYVIRPKAQG